VRLRVVRLGPWLVLGLSCRKVVPEDGVGDEGAGFRMVCGRLDWTS